MKRLLIVLASASMAIAPAAAQAPNPIAGQAATRSSAIPRTPDGKPDFTGNWTNATITPLERAPNRPLVITDEAAREMEVSTRRALAAREEPGDASAAPPATDASNRSQSQELVAQFERRWQAGFGAVGGYNSFWVDTGEQVLRIDGQPRSSILIDPPGGRVPPMTPEAQARSEAAAARRKAGGEFDHPELRSLAERCIMSFGNNAGPPMLPNYWYNNNYTFTQTGTHLALLTEMVHDTRIVRIGGTHAPKTVRQWMGDSIGRWEGDTLTVETTNFHPQHGFRGASENLKVTERFTMRDANTILYGFTVDDPTTWTTPFSGELAFRRLPEGEAVYEYACHEGNYSLEGILRGARAQEAEALKNKLQQ